MGNSVWLKKWLTSAYTSLYASYWKIDCLEDSLDGVLDVLPTSAHDLTSNRGWVNAGIDHTLPPGLAVHRGRCGWIEMGRTVYPQARRLRMAADCDDSHGRLSRKNSKKYFLSKG